MRRVTAWQQLRGRAIRAWKSWTNDCYRLMTVLLGYRPELGMDGVPDHETPGRDGVMEGAIDDPHLGIFRQAGQLGDADPEIQALLQYLARVDLLPFGEQRHEEYVRPEEDTVQHFDGRDEAAFKIGHL